MRTRRQVHAERWTLAAALVIAEVAGCSGPLPPGATPDAGARQPVPICGAGGWCWALPRPSGGRINRLWGSGPGDLWAVGDDGLILHHDGRSWRPRMFDRPFDLQLIAGRGRGDAWVIHDDLFLHRLQGERWDEVRLPRGTLPLEARIFDLLVLPDGEAWAVGGFRDPGQYGQMMPAACVVGRHQNGAWKFDWDETDCGPLDRVWAGEGPGEVWAQGGSVVVHWNGRYLTKNPRQKPGPRRGLHGAASGWRLVRDERKLERVSGPGRPPVASREAEDFWAFGPDDLWAVRHGRLEHFDGHGWTESDDNPQPQGVAARSPADVWVVAGSSGGGTGALLHFDGARWVTRPLPRDERGKNVDVAAPAGGDVWALGGCQLWRFDGRRFIAVVPANEVRLSSLFARAKDDVWAGGNGVLLHWNGKTVTRHATSFTVHRLWGDARELWAVNPPADDPSQPRQVQRWNGSAFVVPPELATDEMRQAGFTSGAAGADAIWLVGMRQVARWQAGKVELVRDLPGGAAIWVSPAGEVWVAGAGIKRARPGAELRAEENIGLAHFLAIGGIRGLVWALGKGEHETGLLFRPEP
jgi:hypothetical protein